VNCELEKCVHARVCCLQEDFFDAARRIYIQQPFPKRKVEGAIPAIFEWVYTYCQERSQPAESQGDGQSLHTTHAAENGEAPEQHARLIIAARIVVDHYNKYRDSMRFGEAVYNLNLALQQ